MMMARCANSLLDVKLIYFATAAKLTQLSKSSLIGPGESGLRIAGLQPSSREAVPVFAVAEPNTAGT